MTSAPHAAKNPEVGYIAMTQAKDDQPFFVHAYDISFVGFEVDGGGPSVLFVQHKVENSVAETMVCEPLSYVLGEIRRATDELILTEGDES